MSLSERLRLAALERARQSGQKVDDYVLEPTGVIDLREMERQTTAAVVNTVDLPELGNRTEVDDLYGKPLAEARLWKRVRGTMVPVADDATTDTETDTSADAGTSDIDLTADTVTIDLTEDVALVELDQPEGPTADSALDAQPTAPCQRCGATASRDLIDIFNSLEYYSCDDCGHMWQQKKG